MENAGYLLAAYAIIWVIFFAYLLNLLNKQRRLKKEIDSLKNTLKEKTG
ncbi:MAG: CcmD family protein [Chloroflexota bacterium]